MSDASFPITYPIGASEDVTSTISTSDSWANTVGLSDLHRGGRASTMIGYSNLAFTFFRPGYRRILARLLATLNHA
jgi:hypothetical protein